MKEKVKKALLAEAADLSFGMTGYSYVGATAEELDEARRSKKKKEEESEVETSKTESSEKSETLTEGKKRKKKEESEESESSSKECSEYETTLTEAEIQDIKLSARQIRSLVVASIAESMVNESIDEDVELEQLGLLVEGKLTAKSKEWIKKFLPTIYAS
jgi:superfamily II DNA/RNA helicase